MSARNTKLAAIAGKLRLLATELEELAEGGDDSLGQLGVSIDAFSVMQRSCAGKKKYGTPESAGQAAEHFRESRDVTGLRVYYCDFCAHYHLTKTSLEDFALGRSVQERHG